MPWQFTSKTYAGRDYSWLASEQNTKYRVTRTVHLGDAVEAFHYPDGFLPSGLLIAEYTSGPNTGLFAPFVRDATDGRQTPIGVAFDGFDAKDRDGNVYSRCDGSVILANTHIRVWLSKMPGLVLADNTTADPVILADITGLGFSVNSKR